MQENGWKRWLNAVNLGQIDMKCIFLRIDNQNSQLSGVIMDEWIRDWLTILASFGFLPVIPAGAFVLIVVSHDGLNSFSQLSSNRAMGFDWMQYDGIERNTMMRQSRRKL